MKNEVEKMQIFSDNPLLYIQLLELKICFVEKYVVLNYRWSLDQ